MVDKTIIANYGDSNLGKTESILLVYERLAKIADSETILQKQSHPNGDICVVLSINGINVGISSLGDPHYPHKKWRDDLIAHDCRIILTACHYDGITRKAIKSLSGTYRIFWTSNARIYQEFPATVKGPKSIFTRFNVQWAEEIANLIECWCYA